jgi:gliding motility-associated-like protein
VTIEIECAELVIHSAFSPNLDGQNDTWIIPGIEAFPDNSVLIYNRWGNEVYTKDHYTNAEAWDGTWNGKYLPDGTYFYLVKDGEGNTYNGYVQIQR